MKKLFVAVAITLLSSTSFAGTIDGGVAGNRAAVTAASDCTLLSEDVSLTVSKNVQLGYHCLASTNVIAVAGCHTNGLKAADGTSNTYYIASTKGGAAKTVSDAPCVLATTATKAATEAGVTVEEEEETP